MSQQTPQPPVESFRSGSVSAAIWLKESERDGRTVKTYSVRPQNRYRDKETGEWKTTEYYFPEDLPKLMLVLQKAYEYVALTESNGQGGVAGADA